MKKPILIKALLLSLAVMSSFGLSAQRRTISGTVSEQTGDGLSPIPGAGVVIKGSTSGAVTDAKGNYSISVPTDQIVTLVFSCIGYSDKEVEPGKNSVLNVVLDTSTEFLDDVVVIGYGVQKRSDVAGSVTSIKAEDLGTYPATNVSEMMRGKAAGVQVTLSSGAPGSNSSIQIRGTRSLRDGSNTPMFVIDGIVANSDEFNALSPEEVESIEILKDAASQAIYGARAANGVIMVTTKSGVSENPTITFSSSISSQHLWRNFDFYSPEEWYELRKQAVAADMGLETAAEINALSPAEVINDSIMEKAYAEGKSTDWESLMLQPAILQQYKLGIRGGSKKLHFSANMGYTDHDGMCVIDSRYRRGNFRANVDYEAKDWLTIGTKFSYMKASNLEAPGSFADYIITYPYGQPYDENGEYSRYVNSGANANPLYNGQYTKSRKLVDITRLNGFVDIHPIKGLSYKLQASVFALVKDQSNYKQANYTSGGSAGQITTGRFNRYSVENILNYNVPFSNKDHSLNFTAAHSWEQEVSSNVGFSANNVPVDVKWWDMLQNGVNVSMIHGNDEAFLLSYLARAQYGYKGKYLVNLAVRRDGSSRFGLNNKWGNFPSVSAAWRVSQEDWMKKYGWVSNLKLRASYGLVGNQNGIGYYDSLGAAVYQPMEFGDELVAGYNPDKALSNASLMWETTASANFGVDFGFLDNRINGTVEYYNTITRDLLFDRDINSALGYSSVLDNVAKTRTNGLEISLSADAIRSKDVNLTFGMTYSSFKNEILQLGGAVDEEGNPVNDLTHNWFIGEPINVIYDYKAEGIYQYSDFDGQDGEGNWILKNTVDTDNDGIADAPLTPISGEVVKPGKVKLVDVNGDGKMTVDDRVVYKCDPDFVASFNTSFRYKNFDFYMDWYTVQGGCRRNTYLVSASLGGSLQGKQNGIKVDYWTPDNPSNEWPRPSFNSNTLHQNVLAIQDISYIRLRTLTMGYTIPKSVLDHAKIKSARVGLSATNLLTFTDFLSYSPETLAGDYPEARQFTFSLNLTF